jgi:hypothetical protein
MNASTLQASINEYIYIYPFSVHRCICGFCFWTRVRPSIPKISVQFSSCTVHAPAPGLPHLAIFLMSTFLLFRFCASMSPRSTLRVGMMCWQSRARVTPSLAGVGTALRTVEGVFLPHFCTHPSVILDRMYEWTRKRLCAGPRASRDDGQDSEEDECRSRGTDGQDGQDSLHDQLVANLTGSFPGSSKLPAGTGWVSFDIFDYETPVLPATNIFASVFEYLYVCTYGWVDAYELVDGWMGGWIGI